MTSSTVTSNLVTNNTYRYHNSLKRIKKRKIQRRSSRDTKNHRSWRSETQQKLYRSKLLQALQHVRLSSLHSPRLKGLAIREAANRVLAMTAKGRTRWSRAILTNQVKRKSAKSDIKLMKRRIGVLRFKTKSKKLLKVERKTHDLRRLVPGCWNQPLPVLLEEVRDYICALDMQVKVMSAVADVLSDGSSSGFGLVAGGGSRGVLGFLGTPTVWKK
ncbi:putative transcription factor IBH1 [Helianthus debilis subsp. tardiflorus]